VASVRRTLIPWLAFAGILVAWGIFSSLPLDWSAWQPATCIPACYCEAIQPGAVAQPVNAWSSLAFALAGLLVLARNPGASTFSRKAGYRITFGVALVVIGLGCAFYHASLTFAGQFFDVMGIYLVISFAALFALARPGWLPEGAFPPVYLATNLMLAGALLWLPGVRREVFATLVVITLALEAWSLRRSPRPASYFMGAMVTLAVGFMLWILDTDGLLCNPNSIFQGEAAWHILGALAAWLLYCYYAADGSSQERKSVSNGQP